MPIFKSSEFKGFGFNYDPAAQPFFKALVKENLRLLANLASGKGILNSIKAAKPAYRMKDWPKGVNVVFQPPLTRQWQAPGMGTTATGWGIKDQGAYNAWAGVGGTRKLIPGISAKTQVSEVDRATAYENADGTRNGGSPCFLFYSNTEIISDSGTWFIPHITMGHELIHCLHALYGHMKTDNRQEEYATVGIKGYEHNIFSENKLRKEAGYPRRDKYFADD